MQTSQKTPSPATVQARRAVGLPVLWGPKEMTRRFPAASQGGAEAAETPEAVFGQDPVPCPTHCPASARLLKDGEQRGLPGPVH